jgi:short-subunit dehydrogenase
MPGRPARTLALITGASAGLGAAFARAYARRGCDLALVARRADRLETLARELAQAHGVEALPIPADLEAPDAEAGILGAIGERGRGVDILVNNAGFGIPRRFTETSWDRQRAFLMVMAVAPCALAHAVIPGMVERGFGRIINVASLAGFSPGVAGNTLYPGVKSLLIQFSEALHAEYGAAGVKVTALCPGSVRTEFAVVAGYQGLLGPVQRSLAQDADAVAEKAVRANEAGRLIVIPGLANQLAAALMRILPRPLVRSVINAGASRYLVSD